MHDPSPPRARAATHPSGPVSTDSGESTLLVLERAKQGDRAAAQTLIERAIPAVKRWARGRVPRHVRAEANTEDVLQDAVVNTLRLVSVAKLRSVSGLQFYLRRSVVNRIRDLIRRTRRRGVPLEPVVEPHDRGPSPLETAIRAERLERFLEGLQRVTPADRQLVVWRIELGYSVAEIAARLGKSIPATGMRVTRALQRLTAAISDSMPPTA